MSELAQVLEKTFSQDPKDQQYALNLLEQAIASNFPEFVGQLATVLSDSAYSIFIRKAAGLQLKNTLTAREQASFDKNKTRWLSLPLEVRNHVKQCILQTLGTETRPSTAAQCIAAIACVEFPIKQWPELVEHLSMNVTRPDSSLMLKESSLEALGYICQDMPDKQSVGPILAAIVHGLRSEEASVHVRLAATKALSEIVDWVVTRTLEEHVDAIVDVISAYLQTAELNLYEEAAKCLYKIASRKCSKTAETPIVVSLFRDEPMRQILTAANLAAANSSSSPEHYKYLKALCDMLCALGLHLATVWSYAMKPPPNFSLYLSALTAFFMHPSIYIRAETAQVLATFFGHERISKNEDFLKYVPDLLHFLPKAMHKSCSPVPTEDLTAQYSRMDYENELELHREYIRLREHCQRMVRESAADHFDRLLVVIRDWVLNCCVRNPREVKPDEWEVMKRLIAAVLQASFQLGLATAEVRREYLKMFDAVFQCSVAILGPSTPSHQNGVLSILSSLYPVFDDFPERIPIVLNHLKSILLVENPNNQDIEITATKRHSIALLLKIVSMFPGPVKPYARIVFDLVAEVGDRVSMMQRANLVHVLAALSNLAGSVEEQTDFLRNAIQFDVLFLQGESFSASPVDFLTQSGLTSAPNPAAIASQNCPYYQGRLNLKASLTAMEGVLSQLNVPSDGEKSTKIFAPFASIVPKFFQFCKTINSIYMPQYSSIINPAYGLSVFEMAPSERQTIVSSIAVDVDSNDGGNGSKKVEEYEPGQAMNGVGSGADMALFMRKFISEISDLVGSILGLACARFPNNIFAIPNAIEHINGTLSAIEHVPNFRLRFWVRKAWGRMATSCPVHSANAILPLMLTLTSHLQKRLVDQWAAIVRRRQSADEDDDPTEDELIAESTMSLLSRECAFFIVNFVLGETFSLKNARKEMPVPTTPISAALMNDKELFLGVLGLLAKLITCPDSQAAIKCLPVLNVLVYNYNNVFDEQTAVHLLVHSIQSLQMYSKDELAAGPILVLIFNIYAQLRPRFSSLLEVLRQVPTCLSENIESFDQRIMLIGVDEGKMLDKMKRDLMRKVLTSTKSRAHYRRDASSETNGIEEEREME